MRLIIIIGLLCVTMSGSALKTLPCHFLDSINITGGFLRPDESIMFDGIVYPRTKYAPMNYILKDGTDKIAIDPHIRGCICEIESCLRLCCPLGTHWIKQNRTGACEVHEGARNSEGNILHENKETEKIFIDNHFAYVHGKPCKLLHFDEDYRITHRGEILLTHRDYCLRAKLNDETDTVKLEQLICIKALEKENPKLIFFAICMLISVVFIIATLLVYSFVSKLRNLQGNILICYLIALAVAYTLLAFNIFNGTNYIRPQFCYPIGYIMLFSFLSAFLWLNVMNFDFWLNFQSNNCLKLTSEKQRFILYTLYGWCLPGVLTSMVFLFDRLESFPSSIRPGIGYKSCFLDPENIFLYFFLPLGIIFTINIAFFVLTALKIRQLQQELAIRSQEGSFQNQEALNIKKDSFILYLRLFFVMGVVWCMEVISFVISSESSYFLLTDICNTLQGVFIFILFVLKRRVLHLIKERWNTWRGKNTLNDGGARGSASGTYVPLNLMSRSD